MAPDGSSLWWIPYRPGGSPGFIGGFAPDAAEGGRLISSRGDDPDPLDERPPETAAFEGVARAGRRGPLIVILGAVAVLAVALLTQGSTPSSGPERSPPVASARPLATPASPASTTVAVPERDPSVTPIPDRPRSPISGSITLTPEGSSSVEIALTVPDGWSSAGPSMVALAPDGGRPSVSLSAWIIADVFAVPCRWSSEVMVDHSLLSSAAGQAEALVAWWGQDPRAPLLTNVSIAPLATRPTRGSIAGRNAWLVGVLVRRDFDYDACDGNQLVLWRATNGAVRSATEPGQLHRLHVVDVGGAIVVIDATSSTSASVDDQTALLRVISSMSIGP